MYLGKVKGKQLKLRLKIMRMALELVKGDCLDSEIPLSKLYDFHPISLDEMNEVKLLDRFDSKYWFSLECLPEILGNIQDNYQILEIEGERIQQYETIYYDTLDDEFYLNHHNGKLNRLKIRKRQYVNSAINFLEIKKKNNKGKTIKQRIPIETFDESLSLNELKFIYSHTGLSGQKFKTGIKNSFSRITLVHKDFTERCTIDLNLSFTYNGVRTGINRMAIIELKKGNNKSSSEMEQVMKICRIYQNVFSKYCIGRAILQPGIKQNLFKDKLIRIKKNYTNN